MNENMKERMNEINCDRKLQKNNFWQQFSGLKVSKFQKQIILFSCLEKVSNRIENRL